MSESSLSRTYDDFRKTCGHRFGYGRNTADRPWTTEQLANLEEMLIAGVREAYGYAEWTFLHPQTTLTTVASTDTYDCPDSFAGLEGRMTFAPAVGRTQSIGIKSDVWIRTQQQLATLTGFPTDVAVVPLTSNGQTGQRFQFVFWPTPSDAWVLTYRYRALQQKLSATVPYPLGGAEFGPVIEAFCLAEGEKLLKDTGEEGPLYQAARARAEKYKMDEAARMAPDSIGFNTNVDPEDMDVDPRAGTMVSYGGVFYD